MKNLMLTFLFSTLVISCASKHPGNFGKPLGNKKAINIVVSGKTVDSKLDSPFQQIELTVENTSTDWVRITRSDVVIDDPGKSKISVVVGNDLVSWSEANQYEQTLKDQNERMATAGIAAAGAAVAIGGAKSRNSGATSAGLVTLLGAAAVSDAKAITQSQSDTERALKVPGHHLYTPFAVPGKMFIRKWLLMNKPAGVMINNLVVEFETVEGVKESYVIEI